MEEYIYWVVVVSLFIFGVLLNTIRKKVESLFDSLIDYLLYYFKFRISYYKKRTREIYELLDREISENIPSDGRKFTFKYEQWDEHTQIPVNWKIIKISESLDKKRIDASIILQLPASSKYKIERNLMQLNYKKAFFFAMSRKLAIKMKKSDVISAIDDKVEKCGVLREFQICREILNNKEKFAAMICEARRKWKFVNGDVGSTTKREFCKFLDDLSKGNVGVLNIWAKIGVDAYFTEVKSNLAKYNILHIYARGRKENSHNLFVIEALYNLIKKKLRKIEKDDLGIYDWIDKEENIAYKARTIILRKK